MSSGGWHGLYWEHCHWVTADLGGWQLVAGWVPAGATRAAATSPDSAKIWVGAETRSRRINTGETLITQRCRHKPGSKSYVPVLAVPTVLGNPKKNYGGKIFYSVNYFLFFHVPKYLAPLAGSPVPSIVHWILILVIRDSAHRHTSISLKGIVPKQQMRRSSVIWIEWEWVRGEEVVRCPHPNNSGLYFRTAHLTVHGRGFSATTEQSRN